MEPTVDNVNGAVDLTPIESRCSDTNIGPTKADDSRKAGAPTGAAEYSAAPAQAKERWGPERRVVLERQEGSPLGISIVGGQIDPFKNAKEIISGIFIKNIIPNTPAGRNGTMEVGDRILEVNGSDLREASYEDAVKVIRGAPTPVKFLVQSLLKQQPKVDRGSSVDARSSTADQASSKQEPPVQRKDRIGAKDLLKDVVIIDKTPVDKAPADKAPVEKEERDESAAKDDSTAEESREEETEEDEEEETEDDENNDDDEEGADEEDDDDEDEDEDEEDTPVKTKRPKYSDLNGIIHTIDLDCGNDDLGLSLAGNRDLGTMSVFVAGVRPNSTVARDGRIIVGDELLEVNGQLLFGRSHLNASAIIKGETFGTVRVMFIRSNDALDRMAVKPLTPIGTPHNTDVSGDHDGHREPADDVDQHDNKHKLTDKHENGVADFSSPVKSPVQSEMHQDCNRRLSSAPLDVPAPASRRRSSASTTPQEPARNEALVAPEQITYKEFTIDLVKKHGRGLGVSLKGSKENGGIFISEMVKGGLVDLDGRLSQGDQILSVNGEDLVHTDPATAVTVIKTLVGKLALTVRRTKSAPSKNVINGEHLRKSMSSAEHGNFTEGSEGLPSSESY